MLLVANTANKKDKLHLKVGRIREDIFLPYLLNLSAELIQTYPVLAEILHRLPACKEPVPSPP